MAKKPKAKSDVEGSSGLELSSPQLRIVLLVGRDMYTVHESTRIVRQALEKRHGEVDVVTFDGEQRTAAEVLDECRSFGLIATHKLVIVDSAERIINAESRPAFERYAANPSEGATLVLRAGVLTAGNLGKAIEEVGAVIACKPPDAPFALAWVLRECQPRHKIAINEDAAALLVERIGPVLAQLDTELEKLAVASGEAPAITRELVAEFVGKTRDEEAFALQGKILTSPPSKRIEDIRYSLEVTREAPVLLQYAITDLARKLHGLSRGLKAGGNPFQLKSKLKIWGPSGDALMAAAENTDWRRALAVFRGCIEATVRNRTGLGTTARSLEIAALRFPRVPTPPQQSGGYPPRR